MFPLRHNPRRYWIAPDSSIYINCNRQNRNASLKQVGKHILTLSKSVNSLTKLAICHKVQHRTMRILQNAFYITTTKVYYQTILSLRRSCKSRISSSNLLGKLSSFAWGIWNPREWRERSQQNLRLGEALLKRRRRKIKLLWTTALCMWWGGITWIMVNGT